jgi:indolepyruvate ferredoxin oxidoreductase, alpha subunit
MLGASINYPVRGAVTWKSIVGTNVASDALSNLASPGVMGGALIVVGEDYGEGASVIQERTHAFALKSSIWLLDPRPDLPTIVRMVEKGFELSEASNAPVIMELRIRACHVPARSRQGQRRRAPELHRTLAEPAPSTTTARASAGHLRAGEADKVDERLPAARDFIVEHGLNELFDGDLTATSASSCRAGCSTALMRALRALGLADVFGECAVPCWCLNVTYPLVPDQIAPSAPASARCWSSRRASARIHRAHGRRPILRGRSPDRAARQGRAAEAGEYTAEVLGAGSRVPRSRRVTPVAPPGAPALEPMRINRAPRCGGAHAPRLPPRPPTFCTGCPERPVFSAMKLVQKRDRPGAYLRRYRLPRASRRFAPFLHGQLDPRLRHVAGERAGGVATERRTSGRSPIMGDGGFWHNGLLTGVASALFNKGDSACWSSCRTATPRRPARRTCPRAAAGPGRRDRGMDIERTLRARRQVDAQGATATRRQDGFDAEGGADHRRQGPQGHHRRRRMPAGAPAPRPAEDRRKLARGERVVRTRSASTTRSAPATIPASACPAARR